LERDVLLGDAAEKAMADTSAARHADERTAGEREGGPAYLIESTGVGPFRLGMPRAAVIVKLAGVAWLRRVPRAKPQPHDPTVEQATLPGVAGAPLLSLRLVAGQLVEVSVVAKDRRALTGEGIQVGSTFRQAIDAHGEARVFYHGAADAALGYVLQDLPGVVLVPADPHDLRAETPPLDKVIGRLRVLGPEATAPD
jgi:hypothetical protein